MSVRLNNIGERVFSTQAGGGDSNPGANGRGVAFAGLPGVGVYRGPGSAAGTSQGVSTPEFFRTGLPAYALTQFRGLAYYDDPRLRAAGIPTPLDEYFSPCSYIAGTIPVSYYGGLNAPFYGDLLFGRPFGLGCCPLATDGHLVGGRREFNRYACPGGRCGGFGL